MRITSLIAFTALISTTTAFLHHHQSPPRVQHQQSSSSSISRVAEEPTSIVIAASPLSLSSLHQRKRNPLLRRYVGHVSNQLTEEGLTVSGIVEEYNRKNEAKRAKEDEEAARLASGSATSAGGLAGLIMKVNEVTESSNYMGIESVFTLALVTFVLTAWSGIATKGEWISYATEDMMRSTSTFILFVHAVLGATSTVAMMAKERTKEGEAVLNGLRTFVVGGLDLLRVVVAPDQAQVEEKALAQAPPLSMEISTFEIEATKAVDGVLLSTTIRTLPGKHGPMRKLLEKLVKDSVAHSKAVEGGKALISTIAVNQDPEDGRNFLMMQRFPSIDKMKMYQNNHLFTSFTTAAQPLLSDPFGLYLVNERRGRLSEPNYPFGPGGEGGRDDAIYSSPTNLDGSQGGAFATRKGAEVSA